MLFDKTSRTMSGLVPITTQKMQFMKLTGTDKTGLSASAIFNISYVSKPYLNRALDNYAVRTETRFSCSIPSNTFIHPNND